MTETFKEWLNGPECLRLLKVCADQVSRRAARANLLLDDAYLEAEDRGAYLSAVASGLWQFLKEQADNITRQATALLAGGDDGAFMAFLTGKYLDYCRDKRREQSPFHDYYRLVRTILSKADGLRYEATPRKGSYYAFSDIPELNVLPKEDTPDAALYAGWKECSAVSYRDVFSEPAILLLSRHFWDEALAWLLTAYLLPIRELVKFVFVKYPVMLSVTYSDNNNDEEQASTLNNKLISYNDTRSFDDAWKRQVPEIDRDVVDTQLATLAQGCVAQLNEVERYILAELDYGVSLEAIAQALDMKRPSNVNYHQKKAYLTLHNHWSIWGPPSLKQFADVDEEEFFMFYEKVILFCKNDQMSREFGKGTLA